MSTIATGIKSQIGEIKFDEAIENWEKLYQNCRMARLQKKATELAIKEEFVLLNHEKLKLQMELEQNESIKQTVANEINGLRSSIGKF